MEEEKYAKMIDDIEEYVGLDMDRSCLDGWFSSSDLKKIAEAMDAWKFASIRVNSE